jgi:hypothetical protein
MMVLEVGWQAGQGTPLPLTAGTSAGKGMSGREQEEVTACDKPEYAWSELSSPPKHDN